MGGGRCGPIADGKTVGTKKKIAKTHMTEMVGNAGIWKSLNKKINGLAKHVTLPEYYQEISHRRETDK
jgi:hypothetical protein